MANWHAGLGICCHDFLHNFKLRQRYVITKYISTTALNQFYDKKTR